MTSEFTEDRVFAALYRGYGPVGSRTANVCVRHTPAYEKYEKWPGVQRERIRYVDALVVQSQFTRLWAVEIKVSASDLKSELRTPEKAEAWAKHVNQFYIAVPPDLEELALSSIPPNWGVLGFAKYTIDNPRFEKLEVRRRAKYVAHPIPLETRTLFALARKAGKQDFREIEGRIGV